ncbi:MAG: hypothetical protein AB1467_07280, partial [Candidatus Diapherotrites archaeon]
KSIVTPEGLKNNLQNTRGVLSLRPKLLPLFRAVSDRNETMPNPPLHNSAERSFFLALYIITPTYKRNCRDGSLYCESLRLRGKVGTAHQKGVDGEQIGG